MIIAVSACLLGVPCRFDGEARPCDAVRALEAQHTLVPICPESMAGLPIPRLPNEIVTGNGKPDADAEAKAGAGAGAQEEAREAANPGAEAGEAANPGAEPGEEAGAEADAEAGPDAGTGAEGLARTRRVVDSAGVDNTAAFERGARLALERAQRAGCTHAIMKAKSPSCGSGRIYDGTFTGTLADGWGIAAQLFRDAGIAVTDENALPA